ncbi:hypothetical protein OBK24_06220 [Empedobacter falsenii]
MNCYKYKYQGQERQDELGLNWDSFKWRNYDYAIARFFNIDPLAEQYSYQSPYNFAENRVVDGRELEGLEAKLLSTGVYEWRVNFQTGDKFDNNYVKNHLQEVSNILSQNEGFLVTLIEDKNASFGLDISKDFFGASIVDGQITVTAGKATLGNPIDQTVSSDGNASNTAHEFGHAAGVPHIFDEKSKVSNTSDNINNLMNSNENDIPNMRSSGGTEIKQGQTDTMINTINASQSRLNSLEEQKKQ